MELKHAWIEYETVTKSTACIAVPQYMGIDHVKEYLLKLLKDKGSTAFAENNLENITVIRVFINAEQIEVIEAGEDEQDHKTDILLECLKQRNA